MASVEWQIRPMRPETGRQMAERLWRAAMPPSWPVLPAGIELLDAGLAAEAGPDTVGLVALDPAGSIPLILVDPRYQRCGIGASLLQAAVSQVRGAGATSVTAGSGGAAYIWPGVPLDLPAAVRFFAACGWQRTHDVLDLVHDLAGYRPQPGVAERAAAAGVIIARPDSADLAAVRAFEAANFPSWARFFAVARAEHILLARDRGGGIVGTLLLRGPGADADTVFGPMLGPAAATIGCVGVDRSLHGQGIGTALVVRASQILSQAGARACHIGWTARESFYRRAGYQPWRRYAMYSAPPD
jgi:GNAT superfamily N-acetyltransferase